MNEKVREKMFNLRQTWNEHFPQTKLYALDVKVNVMDNNWPITAKVVPQSVHVNPNFLARKPTAQPQASQDLIREMQVKQRELLKLEQRKIELELLATKKKIAEAEKEILGTPSILTTPAPSQRTVLMSGVVVSFKKLVQSDNVLISKLLPSRCQYIQLPAHNASVLPQPVRG